MHANTLLSHAFLSSARERGILSTNIAEPPLLPQHKLLDKTKGKITMDDVVQTAISWQLEHFVENHDGNDSIQSSFPLPRFSLSLIQWLAYQMGVERDILQRK